MAKDHDSMELAERHLNSYTPAFLVPGTSYDQMAPRRQPQPDREYPLKQSFDRVAAAVALVLLAPLLALIAGLIYLTDRGNVFFAQPRLGKNGQTFRCLKFRSMVLDAETALDRHLHDNPAAAREWRDTRKLKEDPRITTIGSVLRKSSLDELPQLINIARGEMSMVGPRPIVEEEAPYYGSAIEDYMSVRPGLTGLWQISGRNDVGYGERVQLDQYYTRTLSLWGDMRIIFQTFRVVAQRRGSY
ncbi:exopolysaccharide production protein ExoY [Tranquillimonas rosea]|uniref:Exopolysaccharide production protein ExoY n=1 Tax=Tranquillimonas rosea TaxID=641238 RepID=A0A1H9WSQ4_9RHOB|nr:sugar transferase [Tranquillimonas rosea]SES36915.1 exopolysaccharide production protein ExoY [Tranquillimonas rosea]